MIAFWSLEVDDLQRLRDMVRMTVRHKTNLALVCLFAGMVSAQVVAAAQVGTSNGGSLVVSPKLPKDSRGETVYQSKGPAQKDQPAVSGMFVKVSAIELPTPKYLKSLKQGHADADVAVEGVVSESGDYIDAIVTDPEDLDPEIENRPLMRLQNTNLNRRLSMESL
jgi:hypothetical protein